VLCRELSIVCGNIDGKSIQNFTFFLVSFLVSQLLYNFKVVLDNDVLF